MIQLCACGCGKPAPIATMTRRARGQVKGQPIRFINGHNGRRPLAKRFWEKVQKTEACWLWTATCDVHGYGRFAVGGTPVLAHRVGYELMHGAIPEGLELDHLCRNPSCVRPDHLQPVSHTTNMRRGRPTKLTANEVRWLRSLHAAGTSATRLAAMFGIGRRQVWMITSRRSW